MIQDSYDQSHISWLKTKLFTATDRSTARHHRHRHKQERTETTHHPHRPILAFAEFGTPTGVQAHVRRLTPKKQSHTGSLMIQDSIESSHGLKLNLLLLRIAVPKDTKDTATNKCERRQHELTDKYYFWQPRHPHGSPSIFTPFRYVYGNKCGALRIKL